MICISLTEKDETTMPEKGLPLRFHLWYQHEKEVHAKVLDSLETVPEESRSESTYRKALDLFAHILAARRMWLLRMGRTDHGATREEEIFPTGAGLADLWVENAEVATLWTDYLESLDHDEVGRAFTYTAFEGGRFTNTVEEILTQLHGHSWYHRGQIASIVRSLGGEPAVTDYVFWTRRPANRV
jgi:uncharacterized damage-inducible protein DinB